MTQSQQVLVSLLKKSLFNFEAKIPGDVNWQEVYEEANFQSVIPFVYDATVGIDNIPGEILKKLKAHTIAVMFNNENVMKAQKELCELLETEKFDYSILKGMSIAKDYTKPQLRTLGDVDVLVRKEKYQTVKKLLSKNGYLLIDDGDNHFHCAFKKNGVVFEIHFEITDFPDLEKAKALRKQLDSMLDKVQKVKFSQVEFNSLEQLYQAVSLLLHMERHISKDGLGLRQILDWGFFILNNRDFFENEKNVAFLKKYGIYNFAIISTKLFNKYFLDQDVESEVVDSLFELSLKKGNFGVKREIEETYANGSIRIHNKNRIIAFFVFTQNRSLLTWSLAKKYNFFKYFGFIYLPIRHIFKKIFKSNDKISYKKVIDSVNEVNEVYKELGFFEGNI